MNCPANTLPTYRLRNFAPAVGIVNTTTPIQHSLNFQGSKPPCLTKISIMFAERLAHQPRPPCDPLARQQAIENALSVALHLVRTSDTTEALLRATGRAIRAASLLKQACTEANSGRA